MLDIFNDDMFGLISLTLAMEQLPYRPTFLQELGLFKFQGITTQTVVIEENAGRLTLVPTAARGTMPTWQRRAKRGVRAFVVPHLPINETILADDIAGRRVFGSEDREEAITEFVNERLQSLKDSLSLTFEFHKVGALRGQILDADLQTVIYDWFDEFGIVQEEVEFDFAAEAEFIKLKALDVIELIENAIGAGTYDGVVALCGKTFYRNLLTNPEVVDAMRDLDENVFARTQQRQGFEFADIEWVPYRGAIGADADNMTPFVPDDECVFFPRGVDGLFWHYASPANFMETVGTVGKDMYAKQRILDFDLGVELHAQANPLMICTRPKVLVKGVDVTPPFGGLLAQTANNQNGDQNGNQLEPAGTEYPYADQSGVQPQGVGSNQQ